MASELYGRSTFEEAQKGEQLEQPGVMVSAVQALERFGHPIVQSMVPCARKVFKPKGLTKVC